jgi:hypothetical protein
MIVDGRAYWFEVFPNNPDAAEDAFGAGPLIVPQGSRMELRFAAFLASKTLRDIANFESAKFVVRKDDATGQLLATKTIAAEEMNADLTLTQWKAREAQHFTIVLAAEETNWRIVAKWRGKLWWELAITTTGGQSLACWGVGECRPSGISTAGESGVTGDDFYNATQSDARYALAADLFDQDGIRSDLLPPLTLDYDEGDLGDE